MSSTLNDFIKNAQAATYAGGGGEVASERPGFRELTYQEGEYSYRDSYAGFYRSRGMEVVRKGQDIIWTSLYGGGMVEGHSQLADQTFAFLKTAMQQDSPEFSVRGPQVFIQGDWEYTYEQFGDLHEFHGYEQISYQGNVVFFHRVIGGDVQHKSLISRI